MYSLFFFSKKNEYILRIKGDISSVGEIIFTSPDHNTTDVHTYMANKIRWLFALQRDQRELI